MKSKLLIITALAVLLAGGCAVGPNYRPPQASASAHWAEPLGNGETNGPALLGMWWTNFHDAELNSLVDRAVRSNLDLKMTEARVRAARAERQMTYADLWPSANASGSYQRQQQSRNQPVLGSLPVPAYVPFENNVYQAGFDASWEIDVFGGRRRAVAICFRASGRVRIREQGCVIDAFGRCGQELRGRSRVPAPVGYRPGEHQDQEQSLAITRDRFAHGLTSDLDVEQAATVLTTTQAEVPALEAALETSIHRLGVLLGFSRAR
jgi:multidrug efflux system outer membrane protein